jgi:hypothetical protein
MVRYRWLRHFQLTGRLGKALTSNYGVKDPELLRDKAHER